jgi:hypothetical protein
MFEPGTRIRYKYNDRPGESYPLNGLEGTVIPCPPNHPPPGPGRMVIMFDLGAPFPDKIGAGPYNCSDYEVEALAPLTPFQASVQDYIRGALQKP